MKLGLQTVTIVSMFLLTLLLDLKIFAFLSFFNLIPKVVNDTWLLFYVLSVLPCFYAGYLSFLWFCDDNKETRKYLSQSMLIQALCALLQVAASFLKFINLGGAFGLLFNAMTTILYTYWYAVSKRYERA